MGKVKSIKDKLVTLITGLQYNGNPAFVDVYDYYIDTYTGYPIAVILLSNNQGDFGTSAQNDRVDIFDIHVILSLEDGGMSRSAVQDYMYDLLDLVRDVIDNSQDLEGFVTYMNPTIADPAIVDIGNGESADAKVSVEVRYTVDIN